MECVERTQAVAKAMEEKQFELAVELRGRSFARNLETYKMLTRLKPPKEVTIDGKPPVSDQIYNFFFAILIIIEIILIIIDAQLLVEFWIIIYWNLHIFQCGYRMAVMHIGAPACGMNAAVRSFVRNCIYRGDAVFGIHDGIEGLIAGNIKQMNW